MFKLDGEYKTDQEIKKIIIEYANGVKKQKNGRYYKILSLVPNGGKSILDYGCGCGHFAVTMAEKGNKVEAIDHSANEIEICNLVWGNRLPNVKFVNKKITDFKNKVFDCVVSNQVIEHVHNVGNYLSEINRVLKEEGQLIISLPNIMTPRHLFNSLKKNLENDLIDQSKDKIYLSFRILVSILA